MTTWTLSLSPNYPTSTAVEAAEFSLVLGNPGRADRPLHADWFAGARIEVTHPDGRRSVLRPFGERGPEGPPTDEIFGRSDRERRFVLPEAAVPGEYVLEASLAWEVGPAATARWLLEAPAPLRVALTVAAGAPVGLAWTLTPGARATTLMSCEFGLCDESAALPARLSTPSRRAVSDSSARGLVAGTHAGPEVNPRSERIAWLSGQETLHLGSTAALFDSVACALPGPAGQIVGSVLVAANGSCGLGVLASDGRTLWLLRGAPPVVSPPPPAPEAVESEDDSEDMSEETDELADAEEEDDIFVPRAEVASPAVSATIALPFAVSHGAAAIGAAQRALLLAGQVDDAVELMQVVLDESFGVHAIGRARLEQARLITGCDPWLAIDEQGRARVGLLFEETGDRPAIGLAKLAFDGEARPVYLDGIERRRVATLSARPVAGTMIAGDAATWSLGWCVQLADALVAAAPGGSPRTRALEPDTSLRFALLNEERIAVGLTSTRGELYFVGV